LEHVILHMKAGPLKVSLQLDDITCFELQSTDCIGKIFP